MKRTAHGHQRYNQWIKTFLIIKLGMKVYIYSWWSREHRYGSPFRSRIEAFGEQIESRKSCEYPWSNLLVWDTFVTRRLNSLSAHLWSITWVWLYPLLWCATWFDPNQLVLVSNLCFYVTGRACCSLWRASCQLQKDNNGLGELLCNQWHMERETLLVLGVVCLVL